MEHSESIENIAKAFVAFQGEVQNPKKTSTNPFFKSKYAPLEEILNTIKPTLAKHKLAVMQPATKANGEVKVSTVILHESGEWIKSAPLMLKTEKDTPQGAGSAITYARRYTLSSMLGIESEGDDDANLASGNKKKIKSKEHSKDNNGLASKKQLKYMHTLRGQVGVEEDALRNAIRAYNKESSKELTSKEASEIIDWLLKEKEKQEA